jgi:hypothetical protein
MGGDILGWFFPSCKLVVPLAVVPAPRVPGKVRTGAVEKAQEALAAPEPKWDLLRMFV